MVHDFYKLQGANGRQQTDYPDAQVSTSGLIRYSSRLSSTSSSGSSTSSESSEASVEGVIVRTNPATACRYASAAARFAGESYFSHRLKLFCRCLVFHPNLALMLLIQSSLLLPCGWTQGKGYLLALTVT